MDNSSVKYTDDYSWVLLCPDGHYRCGITELGQQAIGQIIYIELPTPGDNVIQGQPCAVLESKKSVIDIIAPLSGQIAQVNRQLLIDPMLVNRSPYAEGWLFVIHGETIIQSQWMGLSPHEPGTVNSA